MGWRVRRFAEPEDLLEGAGLSTLVQYIRINCAVLTIKIGLEAKFGAQWIRN